MIGTDLTKGETVRLKSGGPLMTVLACKPRGVVCGWFSEAGIYYNDFFDPVILYRSFCKE